MFCKSGTSLLLMGLSWKETIIFVVFLIPFSLFILTGGDPDFLETAIKTAFVPWWVSLVAIAPVLAVAGLLIWDHIDVQEILG